MPTTIQNSTTEKIPVWIPVTVNKGYSDDVTDMVIDAYVKGKQEGYISHKSNEKAVLVNQLDTSLRTAMNIFSEFYMSTEKEFGIDISAMYLKIHGRYNFIAAIILPTDFYYSENRRPFTENQIKLELDKSEQFCKIGFLTIPHKEELNLKKLASNGFIFKYDPQKS